MFQLILGISLGVILLLVILLLITEVASTYPVWKGVDRTLFAPVNAAAEKKDKRNLYWLLLSILGIGAIAVAVYFTTANQSAASASAVSNTSLLNENSQPPAISGTTNQLSGTSVDRRYFFVLQTKWADGKLYGNTTITFLADSVWRFSECRYLLLDKEGFLVKEILFSQDTFAYLIGPDGRNSGVMTKFNTEMGRREYQRVNQLQVVLDAKVYLLP